jgi:hypothetical protein
MIPVDALSSSQHNARQLRDAILAMPVAVIALKLLGSVAIFICGDLGYDLPL